MILSLFLVKLAFASLPDGIYEQDCRAGFRRTESFFQGQVVYSETNFAESRCVSADLEVKSYGSFSLPGPLKMPEDASAIDFVFDRVTITPLSARAANAYRSRRMCGHNEWALGLEVTVTGLTCELFGPGEIIKVPGVGEARYGIYRLDGQNLFLGEITSERNALSPGRRPLRFDLAPYRRR